jgi:DNA modification methylase
MRRDITPKSPIASLRRDYSSDEQERTFDAGLAAATVGMSRAFIARALGAPGTRPKTLTLAQVLFLLDLDGYQETFLPRSRVPDYLLSHGSADGTPILEIEGDVQLFAGNARDLLRRLAPQSVQCVVTSSPYWGVRFYENDRDVGWADGERCPYGFEQTPEGFIRHTVELLYLLKPAISPKGSVWWNLMDTYNTRTPIRGNGKERMGAMGGKADYLRGWTEHAACRHSAGHMYLDDGEQSSIPARVAERASRIGYKLKSVITWRKNSSAPEPVKSRVTRQAEYVLQLSVERTPLFKKAAWQELPPHLGGAHLQYESAEKITDVWSLPTSTGKNGHGAEFPLALPGRCIALSSDPGDLVLDPFIGSGTTALGRRCLGFDISEVYVRLAEDRLAAARATAAGDCAPTEAVSAPSAASSNGNRSPKEPATENNRVSVRTPKPPAVPAATYAPARSSKKRKHQPDPLPDVTANN